MPLLGFLQFSVRRFAIFGETLYLAAQHSDAVNKKDLTQINSAGLCL
jgi:hypothetical protein